jgi:hypothetical protein
VLTNNTGIYPPAATVAPPPPPVTPPPPITIPAAGQSFIDPIFNETITRISDAAARGVAWISTEYSPVCPFDEAAGNFVLIHVDHFALYNGAGFIKDLPISASGEPRWSRKVVSLLYFHAAPSNVLQSLDVVSGAITTVHTFDEYVSIDGLGESDISLDGDHLVLCGQDVNGKPLEVFVYQISTDTKGPALNVAGHAIDSLYIDSNNDVLISWDPPYPTTPPTSGPTYKGMELFIGSTMAFARTLTGANGHKDCTTNQIGPVLCWTNSDENPVTLPAFPNGIVEIDLATGVQMGLLAIPWVDAVHVSCPDTAGFCYVETYSNPTSTAAWTVYRDELLRVWLDGSRIDRLCHHRSLAYNYNGQPKCTCSRDGTKLLFSSNMGQNPTTDYCDVYLIAPVGN